ncbi:MAG: LysR family transcriptional regulator [Acidovorax sp.]|nr:LysR family transcriptional regulator [Acidovorax sp.]
MNLDDLRLFCNAAQRASFAATALDNGTTPAHVSKRIAVLEQQLGVRLFHRTSRRVVISEEGERIYAWARRILEDVAAMHESVAGQRQEPVGVLRVSTSLRLGRNHVSHVLALMEARYPRLDIWLEILDRRADLVEEGIDVDVRIGDPVQPQLIGHRIAAGRRVLCAAPQYLAQRPAPRSLAELAEHQCLLFRDREQAFGVWRLQGPSGMESVKLTGRLGSNHSDIIHNWLLDGKGVALLSAWDVASHLAQGRLVRLLPAYSEPADVWAMTSARTAGSAKVRACIDYLQRELTQGPYALQTTLPGETP